MPLFPPLPLCPVLAAQWRAATDKYGVIGEAHLFLELLDDESDATVAALLALSGVSRDEARLYTQSWLDGAASAAQKLQLSQSASRVLQIASLQAKLDGSPTIEPQHLLLACVSARRGAHLGQVLRPLGLEVGTLRAHLKGLQQSEQPYPRGHPLNDLTECAKQIIEAAHSEMRASYCGRIGTAHLLLALLNDEETAEILQNVGCDLEDLRQRARSSIRSDGEIAMHQKRFSPGAKRALERAAREAKMASNKFIGRGQLLLGLLPQRETLREKWRARARQLDNVDGLWTASQVAALRLSLRGAPNSSQTKSLQLTAFNYHLTLPRGLGIISFGVASIWWSVISVSPPGKLSPSGMTLLVVGLFVLIASGLGACVAMLFGRSSKLKAAWVSVFAGWLLGMMAAMFLGGII